MDYNGAGQLTRTAFTGVTGAAYSSYQYNYVGGVFAGSQFTFTAVPTGATYSSYQIDYDQAGNFGGASFFFTNIQGQFYTGEEANIDPSGALSSVLLTGITDQAYSSLQLDYSAGTYEGYKAYYTGITGQSYTSEEVDASAAGQPEKVVYSGISGAPYSSVEADIPTARSPTSFTISPMSRARATIPIRSRTTPAALSFRKRRTSIAAAMI